MTARRVKNIVIGQRGYMLQYKIIKQSIAKIKASSLTK